MTDEDDELQQQMDEIEALRSIFMEDFHEVCEHGNRIQSVPPEVKCYEIVLSPLASHEDASEIINTDESKNTLVQEGPHLMLLVPQGLFGDLPRDPYTGGPYIMWEGSDYAHIMVPLEKTTPLIYAQP